MLLKRLLIADPSPLYRAGLVSLLLSADADLAFLEVGDLGAANGSLARGEVDLALMDLDLPGMNGVSGLRILRHRFPHIPLAITAWSDDGRTALSALVAGAQGYIPKRLAHGEMIEAFKAVLRGQVYVPPTVAQPREQPARVAHSASLTQRQREVIALLSAGKSNKEIARALNIAEGTVKVHVAAVFRLFGVHNRVSAATAMRDAETAMHSPLSPGIFSSDYAPPMRQYAP